MAFGDLIYDEPQYEMRGVLMGFHTPYVVSLIRGLDPPDIRASDTDRQGDHGVWLGSDFYHARTIELDVGIEGYPAVDMEQKLQDLRSAFAISQAVEPFAFRVKGQGSRVVFARPRRIRWDYDDEFALGIARVSIQMICPDPRIYDLAEQTTTLTLPTQEGGRAYPRVFPQAYGAVSQGGAVAVTNRGAFSTRPSFTITGPVSRPQVVNTTQGLSLSLALDLSAGDWLDISTDDRTVILNGTASRYAALESGSAWWDLPPGTSEVRFRAADYRPEASLTVRWRDAWI